MQKGYTEYFDFHFLDGVVTMKRLSSENASVKVNLLKNRNIRIESLRERILLDIFGVSLLSELNESSIFNLQLKKPVTKVYAETKTRSLIGLLKYIPSEYRFYYPLEQNKRNSQSQEVSTLADQKVMFFEKKPRVGRPKDIDKFSEGQTTLVFSNSQEFKENDEVFNSISSTIWK